jgi:zinc transporter, ZIP family
MESNNWILALTLALLAGLSTGIGGLFVLLFRTTNRKFLSVALGFSAGIMIFISFMEILPDAKAHLVAGLGDEKGGWMVLVAFFAGILLIAAIDKLIPAPENPHEMHNIEEVDRCDVTIKAHKLMKTSILTAIAITIHNFPEGLVTFMSGMSEPKLGIAIAIAVAIHNIPEGIAVAIPVYCATGSRRKAFVYSLLSGAAEPLGAVFAFLFLAPFINELVLGFIFAGIAGIMIYISFDELLPTARQYGEHHLTIYGLLSGMLAMGISLQFLF